MTMTDQFQVMFVCSGNTCRSPMAEYALRSLLEKERPGLARVISSGTLNIAGRPATKFAREAGKIWDLDLSPHLSQGTTKELIDQSDLIFAMAPEHLAVIRQLSPSAEDKSYLLKSFPESAAYGEGVLDPIGMDLEVYNQVFLEIGEYLGKHLPEIIKRLDGKLNVG